MVRGRDVYQAWEDVAYWAFIWLVLPVALVAMTVIAFCSSAHYLVRLAYEKFKRTRKFAEGGRGN